MEWIGITDRIRLIGLPGTGKTTRLLQEIDSLVKDKNVNPQDIIFCSHSNASVNEAKHRIKKQYGYSTIQFTTMHKMAKGLVTTHHEIRYLSILDNTEDISMEMGLEENPIIEFLRTLERKFNSKPRYDTSEKYKKTMVSEFDSYFRIKNHYLPEDNIEKIVEYLDRLYIPKQTDDLTYNHASDPRIGGVFNDLRNDLFVGLYNLIQIIETAWAIETRPENAKELKELADNFLKYQSKITSNQLVDIILSLKVMLTLFRNGAYSFNQVLFEALKYKLVPDGTVLIIDEYQDIGKLQYELSELWANNMEIFLVAGDPNQSIYGFNGVSPDFLENFTFDHEINLFESYRVPENIVSYAAQIYNNHWTEQMISKNPISGSVSEANLDETIQHLYQNEAKSIFILCRSDEIRKYIQLQFLRYGLYSPRKEFSYDLSLALKLRDLYRELEILVNNDKLTSSKFKKILNNIEKIEKEYDISISSNFSRSKITQILGLSQEEIISKNDFVELNLIDNPEFQPSVNISGQARNGKTTIDYSKLKKFQAKRIISMIYQLTVDIENNQAGIQEFDKFIKNLEKYEKRLNIPITRELENEKINDWRHRIKFRNFRNTLEHSHLDKFKITTIREQVEPFAGNGKNTKRSISQKEYLPVFSQFWSYHPKLFGKLNDTDRRIFENTEGLTNTLATLQKLRNAIKFLTMHASKGREADCVVIPSIKTFYEEKNLTDPEESKRVYFVAVTRSKKELLLIKDGVFPKNPSKFLPKVN